MVRGGAFRRGFGCAVGGVGVGVGVGEGGREARREVRRVVGVGRVDIV